MSGVFRLWAPLFHGANMQPVAGSPCAPFGSSTKLVPSLRQVTPLISIRSSCWQVSQFPVSPGVPKLSPSLLSVTPLEPPHAKRKANPLRHGATGRCRIGFWPAGLRCFRIALAGSITVSPVVAPLIDWDIPGPCAGVANWWREMDLNHRPSGYEPDELPDCSIPLLKSASKHRLRGLLASNNINATDWSIDL